MSSAEGGWEGERWCKYERERERDAFWGPDVASVLTAHFAATHKQLVSLLL